MLFKIKIVVTLNFFRSRAFNLLLFTLTFAGISLSLWSLWLLLLPIKQKIHHLLVIIDRLLLDLKHLVLHLLHSSLLLKFFCSLLESAIYAKASVSL